MLPILFPDKSRWPEVRRRMTPRYRHLIDSREPRKMDVGFFLFGMVEATGGRHHA